jgi:WYL domain
MNTSAPKDQTEIPINAHTIEALGIDNQKTVVYAEGVHIEETVELRYASPSGEISVRTVDLHAYLDRGAKFYLVGYCHLRNDLRTFILNQIIEVRSKGESISKSNVLAWIFAQPKVSDLSIIDGRVRKLADRRKPFEAKYNSRSANKCLDRILTGSSSELLGTKWTYRRGEDSIALHKVFSTGKLTKLPQVELSFLEFDSAYGYLGDGTMVEVERFPRNNPWELRSKPSEEVYFGEFEIAEENFLRLVRKVTLADA